VLYWITKASCNIGFQDATELGRICTEDIRNTLQVYKIILKVCDEGVLLYCHIRWTFSIVSFWLKKHNNLEAECPSVIR
jgi:hypothetical protein